MLPLLTAVIVASLLGSLHCVGMCGPFALWASGVERTGFGGALLGRLSCYHGGRLVTYLTAGALAGLTGSLIRVGGASLGIQAAAARLVGVALLALGLIRLTAFLVPAWFQPTAAPPSAATGRSAAAKPAAGRVAGWLARLRPQVARLPGPLRAGAIGSLTTLLPCGWLYLFVLVAAGTGDAFSAMLVMGAFWIGTLPALTGLVLGARQFAAAARPALPLLGAVLLIGTGLYTATGRAAADLAPLRAAAAGLAEPATASSNNGSNRESDSGAGEARGSQPEGIEEAAARLQRLSDTPLPCCDHGS